MGDLRAAPTGRPGYPPLMMLKALLLAQWYGLSDPELEDALADRLSFRRFVGLALDAAVPDGEPRNAPPVRASRRTRSAGSAESLRGAG